MGGGRKESRVPLPLVLILITLKLGFLITPEIGNSKSLLRQLKFREGIRLFCLIVKRDFLSLA